MMDSLAKLSQTTLSAKASVELMQFIQRTEMRPGDVLPREAKIAEQLGVSRPVVREALHGLQGQGVIEIINGRGAVIRPLDPRALHAYFGHALRTLDRSMLDLMEARRGIEVEAVALAAIRRSGAEAEEMEAIVALMSDAPDATDYARLDTSLHVAIAQASHNTVLHQLVLALKTGLMELSTEGLKRRTSAGEMNRVQAMHIAIVTAVSRQDPEGAAEAMRIHMNDAITILGVSDGKPEV